MGATTAGLVFGDGSPAALATAHQTALASSWVRQLPLPGT